MPPEVKDVLGIGTAVDTAVKGLMEGAAAFLGRICLPVAEELGFLLRDRVAHWRDINRAKIAIKAEEKLLAAKQSEVHAHPRLVGSIIDQGSWADTEEVQEMWAGLLASACTDDGQDDENLLFVNLLGQLTGAQARLLNYACKKAKKSIGPGGLIWCDRLTAKIPEIRSATGVADIHRIDRELDHLRSIGLIQGGISVDGPPIKEVLSATITPTALAINMYVRCLGSRKSPIDFFGLNV